MSRRKKIWIAGGVIALLLFVVIFSISASRKNTVPVQTSIVERKDVLSSKVTASGEIRAKKFVDLQSETQGIITELYVHEGDSVKKGDILLQIDPIQTNADVAIARANYEQALANSRAQEIEIANAQVQLMQNESNLRSARAELERAEYNFSRLQNRYERQSELMENGLISRDDFEKEQNDYRSAKAGLEIQKANLASTEKQIDISRNTIEKMKNSTAANRANTKSLAANLTKVTDQSKKSRIESPLDGVITQLNKEKGERAVPGNFSNPEATIMTIADLSTIQAELKVDETDIVNLSLGDITQVEVDALPDEVFEGKVTEIGNSPILSSGSSQEAKDFKVVVTLMSPSNKLRPGMSCTGEITTDTKKNALVIPIQALTIRDVEVDKDGKYHPPDLNDKKSRAVARADSGDEKDAKKKEMEGVFVINENTVARFRPIKTGITGESEIEVLENLKEGEEIVSGSFQTLRTIKDGAAVKIEKTSKSRRTS